MMTLEQLIALAKENGFRVWEYSTPHLTGTCSACHEPVTVFKGNKLTVRHKHHGVWCIGSGHPAEGQLQPARKSWCRSVLITETSEQKIREELRLSEQSQNH